MAVDAEELLIQPLRVVVALGSTAVSNATAAANKTGDNVDESEMSRAARALVREGERALNKVQTVWETQVEKYGEAFRDMILRQGSIETRRLRVEDLLWDFDDFITPEEFNQERYSSLQAATRAFALDLSETAKRFRPSRTSASPATPISPGWPSGRFPPLPPLPAQPSRRSGTRRSSHAGDKLAQDNEPLSEYEQGPAQQEPTGETSQSAEPEPSEEAHTSWLLSDNPSQGQSNNVATSEQSDTCVNSPDSISEGRAPSWPEPKDKFSAIRGSMQSTETSVSGSTLDATATPASPLQSNWKHDQGSASSLIGATEAVHIDDSETRPRVARQVDCSIGPGSTYHRLKGFCEGGTRFRNDGYWDSIVRTTEYSAGTGGPGGEMLRASDGIIPLQFEEETKIGRCSECSYSHNLDEMELDLSLQPQGTHRSGCGAQYRLRLLYKSHMRTVSGSESRYACLWCVQANATVREGDATVFLTSGDLLRHLAGHPQPLPTLTGVSVRYGALPKSDSHGYDLHLPDDPAPVPVPDGVAKLSRALAIKDHCRRPGRSKLDRPPKYDGEMLEFLSGAIIVGVMFPEKWDGKWCLGRHDGKFGAFPAKAIEIQTPQESEIPMGSGSGMSVVARWKWPPTETPGMPWLQFTKGEVISNVQCVYADYWCWSGTNRQGKTGVFPRSHIDLRTLKEQTHTEVKKKRGFRLFGRRGTTSTASQSS